MDHPDTMPCGMPADAAVRVARDAKCRVPLWFAWVLASHVGGAWAQDAVFTDVHSLLVQTIRAGHASAILTGPIDEHFTRQFKSTGTLRVRSRVIKLLVRPACKRVEVVYTKDDVDTPKGRTQAILRTELDYCMEGGPPTAQGATP